MDMKKYASMPVSDIESYQYAASYELAGKEFTFKMDDGSSATMAFAAFPCKEVCVNGAASGVNYDCVKISDHVVYFTYRLPEAFVAYVLDMEKGRITRAVTGTGSKTVINFGVAGNSNDLQTFTDDLSGNKVRWTLGKLETSTFLAAYGADGLSLTRPYAADAPAITASDFRAVKITDSVYLQTAVIQTAGETVSVNMVSNFWNITCVGSIYGVSATKGVRCKLFAGYGRFMNE